MTLNRMQWILVAALLGSGCTMPDGDLEQIAAEVIEEDVDADSNELELASTDTTLLADSETLSVPRLHTHQEIHYGGTIFEEDHFPHVGGLCSPGYVRVDPPTVSWSGHGHCNFDGWANPANPRDCTARIHLHHSAGWLYGNCYIDIFETRSAATCQGRDQNYCGRAGLDGTCHCDPACETYGDCCFDYAEVCR